MTLIGVGGYALFTYEQPIVVQTSHSTSTAPLPEWAQDEEAVQAAQDVIKRKEQEAELHDVQSQIDALEAREAELEKELGLY